MSRIYGSKNQGVETGVTPLTIITLSDPLAKYLFSFPKILCFAGLEVLVPKREMLPSDAKMISLNWKLRLPANHSGLLVLIPLKHKAKKGVNCAD